MLDEADRICDRVGVLRTKLLAVGSPKELRRSLWGRRTVVQVGKVTNDVVSAVEAFGLKVEVFANKLIIQVANPEGENPDIIDVIHAAGGRIQFVSEVTPTLEDVYLRLVKGRNNGPRYSVHGRTEGGCSG
jgi:ABC-2 type transport system ATP-binding protein